MTTIISRPFDFVETQDVDTPSADEASWLPYMPPSEPAPPLIKAKYIYAFSRRGRKTELYAEYFANGSGQLSVCAGDIARSAERDKRGPFATLGGSECALPHTVNGKRVLYSFYVSPTRLPVDAILTFESNPPKFLAHFVDLNEDSSFVPVETGQYVSLVSQLRWTLPVTDPMAIALRLHVAYATACNNLLGYTTTFEEQTPQQAQRVRDRHSTLILARLLRSVIDNDPSDKLGLINEFRGSDRRVVHQFIDDYEKTVKHLIETRDRAGEALSHFIGGSTITFAEDVHRIHEVEDYAKWIEFMGIVMSRLSECPMGKARIGKLIDSPNYLFQNYILRTSPPPDGVFAVGRKAHAAILSIWKDAAAGIIIKNLPSGTDKIVRALHLITKEDLVEIKKTVVDYGYRKGNGRWRDVTHEVTEIVPKITAADALTRWTEQGTATKIMGSLAAAIELINFGLAVQAIREADDEKKGVSLLNMVGGALDTVNAFGVLVTTNRKALKLLKGIAAISAVLDAVCAALDGYDAYNRDDTSSAVGYGAVSIGSALVFLGSVCALTGAGAAVTVVGIPLAAFLEVVGAVLISAGWLVAVFTADSEIELLVSHCRFGINFPSSSSEKLKCYPISFSKWSDPNDGALHQVRGLTALLAQFKVMATSYSAVRITFGLVLEDSMLRLDFKSLYNLGIRHEPQLLVDLGNRSAQQIGSPDSLRAHPQDLSKVKFSENGGRLILDVDATWPNDKHPDRAVQHQGCTVDVRLHLDASTTIPFGRKPFSYIVHELGLPIRGEASSSD